MAPTETDASGVLLDFVDIHGIPRGAVVPADRFETEGDPTVGFAGLVLDVFETRTDRGVTYPPAYGPNTEEIRVVPDRETAITLPWTDGDLTNVRCSLTWAGEPLSTCPRTTLGDVLDDAADAGFSLRVGSEIEYTVLDTGGDAGDDSASTPSNQARPGGFDATDSLTADAVERSSVARPRPYDARGIERASAYVTDVVETAVAMDIGTETVQRESAPGQFEASLDHHPAARHADHVVSMRRAVRAVGREYGLDTTFMPFPIGGYEGNGLHVHLSAHDGDEYVFADPDDALHLSSTGYQFIGGILDHVDALTALCAPTVNSYKRFQPGTFGPVDRAYGRENRTALVRIPRTDPEKTRIEVRLADSYANPYLALAGIVAAGLDGIETDADPGEPTNADRYEADEDESEPLPASLPAALDALEADDVLVDALGEELVELFCKLKRDECDRFAGSVTDWELDEYVDKL